MKMIGRDGSEVPFDSKKIDSAISRVNEQMDDKGNVFPEEIRRIADQVTEYCRHPERILGVEEVQELVEHEIMENRRYVCRYFFRLTVGLPPSGKSINLRPKRPDRKSVVPLPSIRQEPRFFAVQKMISALQNGPFGP